MILLDSLDGVMNAHKMNDFALSLGLLSLQSVFIAVSFDSYSRSWKQHIVAIINSKPGAIKRVCDKWEGSLPDS